MLDNESNPTPDFSADLTAPTRNDRGELISGKMAGVRYGLSGQVIPFLRMAGHLIAVHGDTAAPRYFDADCRMCRDHILAGRIKLSACARVDWERSNGPIGAKAETSDVDNPLEARVETLEAELIALKAFNASLRMLAEAILGATPKDSE